MAGNIANVVFKNIILDIQGCPIKNEKQEILCSVVNEQGSPCEIFIAHDALESCGLLVNNPAQTSQNITPQNNKSEMQLCSEKCQLWKSSKTQSTNDHQATLILLELRLQYENEFKDKKVAKNLLWSRIASKMNEMGYFVGEGMEGREKVRQKFANLQSSFQKYFQKQRQTGEGAVEKPPYFKELEKILGDKHKVIPPLVIDSERKLNASEKTLVQKETEAIPSTASCSSSFIEQSSTSTPSCSSPFKEQSTTSTTPNRFVSVKQTVRPQKEKLVDVIKEMHRENMNQRQSEFRTLIDLLREENQQRHEEIMGIISSGIKKSNTKRKRQQNSDSD